MRALLRRSVPVVIVSVVAAGLLFGPRAHADTTKANNSTALTDGASWVGGVAPGAGDVAIFDNTLSLTTFANGTTPAPLGGDLSVLGIKVGTAAGGPTLGQANNQNGIVISNGGANTLTLGASGIDMSAAAAVPLDIQSRVLIGANQTWNVSPASNNITTPAPNGAGSSTSAFGFQQDEDLAFAAQAADNPFNLNGKTVTKTGTGTVLIHGGYLISNGTVNVNDGFFVVQGGSSRLTTIANTVTLNVNSGGVLRLQSNSGAMLSNANINLNDGATLHMTTNNATLTTTVGGVLHVSGSAVVRAAPNPITNNNGNANNILSANITGDAASNLALRNQNTNTTSSFVLSGDNSGFAGTATLDAPSGRGVVRMTTATAGSAAAKWVINGGNTLEVAGNTSVQLGTLNGDGVIANPTAATTATVNVGAGTFNGSLATSGAGTIAVNKVTAGTLTLGGSNNHAGGTTVSAGTLRLGSGGALGSSTAAVTVNAGATLDLNSNSPTVGAIGGTGTVTNSAAGGNAVLQVSASAPVSFGGVIKDGAGTVGLAKNGPAALTLTGANTYTSPTDVNEGALVVTGSLAATGTVNVNGNATFAGSGSAGNLILQPSSILRIGNTAADGPVGTLGLSSLTVNGGDLRFDLVNPTGSDKVVVAGAANFTGASTLTPTSTPAPGTYVLLTSTDLTGTAPTLIAPPAGTTRSNLTLNFDTAADRISLNVTGNAKSLTWTGTNGPAWDVNTTLDWSDNGTLVANEKFFNLDAVTFGNGPANRNVTLNQPVTPGSVTVNNAAGNDYAITGGGSISDSGFLGGTSLTKSGAGKLTLGTSNTYLGPTIIQEGTVQLATSGALPAGTALTLGAGTTSGTLDLAGFDASVSSLATSGTNAANVIGNSSATTPVTLTVTGGNTTFAGKIVDTLPGGTQTVGLAVTGGTLTLSGANTYSRGTLVSTGATLRAASPPALGAPTGQLTLQTAATLDLGGNAVTVGIVQGEADTTITNTATGAPATLTTNATGDSTLAANITNGAGTVALVKNGVGTLTLGGAGSNYSGGLTVNAGTVRTTTAAAPGTGLSTVNSGGTLVIGAAGAQPITLAGGTIGAASTIGTNAFTSNTLTLAAGTTSTVITADPQDLGSPNREMILTGALKGSGNLIVQNGNSTGQTTDAGPGFRLRGTGASDFSGTITLLQRGKGELQNSVTGNFSPAGTGRIVMTTGTDTLQGTYSVLNLRNNSTGNVTYGNDIEVVGDPGFAALNVIGSAPVGATTTMGNLKIGNGHTLVVSRNTGTVYTAVFPTVTLTGGTATFAPGSSTFGYTGTANLTLGAIGQGAPNAGFVMNGATLLTVTGPSTYTGPTTVDAGTMSVTGSLASSSGVTVNGAAQYEAASAQSVKALTLNGGQARVVSPVTKIALTVGDGTQAASTLSLTGGKLDLQTNGLAVDYAAGAANDTAALASVRGQVIAGFNGGAWTGTTGITSSAAAANSLAGVGYALASDVLPFANAATTDTFLGSTVDKSTVLARYTLSGDLNLDGLVDFLDLARLAQSYNVTDGTRQWSTGDVNYDGNTDFLDLAKMAQNYNTALPSAPVPGAPADFQADLARAFASVPEPSLIGALGLCILMGGGRRRK